VLQGGLGGNKCIIPLFLKLFLESRNECTMRIWFVHSTYQSFIIGHPTSGRYCLTESVTFKVGNDLINYSTSSIAGY
jgi:hypothetical protein